MTTTGTDTAPLTKTALIAGATGAAATRLVEELLRDPDWSVVGVARRPPVSQHPRLRYIAADLTDPAAAARAIAPETAITHLVYACRAPFKEGGVEDVDGNVTLLRTVLDATETAAPGLAHVHLVEGAKWYGLHIGAPITPSREDAARHMPPNFYYDQQDLLAERARTAKWTWSASRPNLIYDFAPQRARNIVSVIGAWATISKELGLPLDFPGKAATYDAICDLTDASQLARGIKWMLTAETARNEAFNLTDGDLFRWKQLWQRVADHFGMAVGTPRDWRLETWMANKGPLWRDIAGRHGLVEPDITRIAPWGFADFVFHQAYDVLSIMTKIRIAGFHDTIATEANLIAHIERYQDARILPRYR
ncbi:MAG: SDR family oxidoreductase [Hyphomicrobiaceae bacterium]|nr:SDR family oxidoreductase [Hyphomicrobiaceae bacterium]